MKTTLELPDALLRKVKATAAGDGKTMTAFITAALESKLASDDKKAETTPWMRYAGVFSKQSRESKKIMSRIHEGCEQLNPEDWT